MIYLGRHVGYPVALEGALKLKEICYIHAEGFAAGELKHGPIALVDEGQPVVVIVPTPRRPELHAKVLANIQEVRARDCGCITQTNLVFRSGADPADGYSRGRYSTSAYLSTVIGARMPCRHESALQGAPPRSHP